VENDFAVRHGLDQAQLVDLFAWSEQDFLSKTEGSAIRRIGHERWLRNIAIALGMRPLTAVLAALTSRTEHPSSVVREHVHWHWSNTGRRSTARRSSVWRRTYRPLEPPSSTAAGCFRD